MLIEGWAHPGVRRLPGQTTEHFWPPYPSRSICGRYSYYVGELRAEPVINNWNAPCGVCLKRVKQESDDINRYIERRSSDSAIGKPH